MSAGLLFKTVLDCSACAPELILFIEQLYNEKWWPGFGSGLWWPAPPIPIWDRTGNPPVSFLTDYRKHWATRTVEWSCTASPGNSETIVASYSGAGLIPAYSPTYLQTSCTPGSSAPITSPCSLYPNDAIYFEFLGGTDPASYPDPDWGTLSWNTISFNTYLDVDGHGMYWSDTLDGAYPFADELSAVGGEVQTRSFPGTYSAAYSIYAEYFDASGSWASSTASGIAIPFYGDNGRGSGLLASFWWWPNQMLLQGIDSMAVACNEPTYLNDAGDKTYANRTKFKVSTGGPISYFVAKARIVAAEIGSSQTLTGATVIDSGTLNDGDELEIPYPTDDSDFVTIALDHGTYSGQNTLSFGQVCFCILGETSSAWSIRTGIPIS